MLVTPYGIRLSRSARPRSPEHAAAPAASRTVDRFIQLPRIISHGWHGDGGVHVPHAATKTSTRRSASDVCRDLAARRHARCGCAGGTRASARTRSRPGHVGMRAAGVCVRSCDQRRAGDSRGAAETKPCSRPAGWNPPRPQPARGGYGCIQVDIPRRRTPLTHTTVRTASCQLVSISRYLRVHRVFYGLGTSRFFSGRNAGCSRTGRSPADDGSGPTSLGPHVQWARQQRPPQASKAQHPDGDGGCRD